MQTESVVRLRAPETTIQTLCPAEPITIGQPGQDARGVVLNGWRLYLPESSDLIQRDLVRVRGTEFSVLGPPAAWLGGGLVADVADIWTAQCTVRRPGGVRGTFDTATGTYPSVPPDPHYTGDCWVYALPVGEAREDAADELLTTFGYLVAVDLDTSLEVQVGDLVKLTAVGPYGDPLLVNRTLQVRSFARGPLTWQRNLICTEYLAPESIE